MKVPVSNMDLALSVHAETLRSVAHCVFDESLQYMLVHQSMSESEAQSEYTAEVGTRYDLHLNGDSASAVYATFTCNAGMSA